MRPAALAFIAAALVAAGCATQPAATRGRPAAVEPLGSPRAPGTSAASLEQVIRESEAALRVRPADSDVAVRLADAWLRQARATGQASQAIKAERVLRTVLLAEPDRADARRLRIAALLAQHRFADALADAERAAAAHPASAWVHAALGDARVQLGHYDLAFAAFDRAAALRPDAASYARIAYGRELTGNLPGALRIMTLAFEAAGPADVEQTAWLLVELGHLHLKLADPRAATRSFARAQHIYPGYEGAVLGAAQAAAATADHLQALALLEPLRPGPAVWRVQLSSL